MALFARGFKLNNVKEQLFAQNLEIPSMKVWLLKKGGYDNKMDAYKAGVAAAKSNLGVYIYKYENQWQWVAAVYMTFEEAEKEKNDNPQSKNLEICEYEVKSKKLKLSRDIIPASRKIFKSLIDSFCILMDLKNTTIINHNNQKDLSSRLVTNYNIIKENIDILKNLNTEIKSPLIASLIYVGNQNILSLQEIICGDNSYSIASLNTVLIKIIFSLDNF